MTAIQAKAASKSSHGLKSKYVQISHLFHGAQVEKPRRKPRPGSVSPARLSPAQRNRMQRLMPHTCSSWPESLIPGGNMTRTSNELAAWAQMTCDRMCKKVASLDALDAPWLMTEGRIELLREFS